MDQRSYRDLLVEIIKAHASGKLRANFYPYSHLELQIDANKINDAKDKTMRIKNHILQNYSGIKSCTVRESQPENYFTITIFHDER